MTLELFARPSMDGAMPALAKRYAARMGWRFTGMEQRPDLFGVLTWRAMYRDGAGGEHERTIDDLRASLES